MAGKRNLLRIALRSRSIKKKQSRGSSPRRKGKEMYETVKIVKGYKITRMKGTHGAYHVNVREDDQIGFREFHTFRTIKAATEFIETAL